MDWFSSLVLCVVVFTAWKVWVPNLIYKVEVDTSLYIKDQALHSSTQQHCDFGHRTQWSCCLWQVATDFTKVLCRPRCRWCRFAREWCLLLNCCGVRLQPRWKVIRDCIRSLCFESCEGRYGCCVQLCSLLRLSTLETKPQNYTRLNYTRRRTF